MHGGECVRPEARLHAAFQTVGRIFHHPDHHRKSSILSALTASERTMGFLKDISSSGPTSPPAFDATWCFGCAQPIEGAAVTYDGHGEGKFFVALLLHPKCANEMGQRLIMDSWPNRRADPRFEKASS